MDAEVIALPKKVKVLCLFEVRKFGIFSNESYWRKDARMIEVVSSAEICRAFQATMEDEKRKRQPWEKEKISAWKLKSYLPENGQETF